MSDGPIPVRDVEFRIVAQDAPVMLWLTNTEGRIIFTNSRWKKFAGAATGEHVSGQAWLDSLHPADRDKCLAVFHEAFSSHQPFEMEYRMQRSDGQYRYVLDTGEPYINKEGKFSGFIGSSTDITDRKDSELQLRRSEQELTQHNREMRLINELNSYLQVCRTLDETHSIVGHYGERIFSDSPGALYMFNDARNAVQAVASWGEPGCITDTPIAADDCWALRQSRVHRVEDSARAIMCRHVRHFPENGYVCAPAIAQGEMIGFLYLQFPGKSQDRSPDSIRSTIESRTRLATIAADNLAMALVSLKLREALRSQSVRDPLTRLFNRRYMEETFERDLSQCKRDQAALSVIILDIDLFKNYNDEFGHDAGDLVLSEVAEIARAALRQGDMACRFGGEELVLVMPRCPREIAFQRAGALQQRIREHQVHYQGKPLPGITVSGGVASFPEDGDTQETILKAADTALYRAKEAGRDRVLLAGTG